MSFELVLSNIIQTKQEPILLFIKNNKLCLQRILKITVISLGFQSIYMYRYKTI